MDDSAASGRVLFLSHHGEDDPGLVGTALERRGHAVDLLMVDEGSGPIDVEGLGALAVLGSKWSVYDDEAVGGWIKSELDAIREADRLGIAVLGICFGAQALCTALGGHVEPAPRLELGWVDLQANDAEGVPAGPWFQFHADRCVVPPHATVLVRNEVCVQAFRVGRNLGVQFHPEIDARQLARWMDAGADAVARDHGLEPSALLAETAAREDDVVERVDLLVAGFLARAR